MHRDGMTMAVEWDPTISLAETFKDAILKPRNLRDLANLSRWVRWKSSSQFFLEQVNHAQGQIVGRESAWD